MKSEMLGSLLALTLSLTPFANAANAARQQAKPAVRHCRVHVKAQGWDWNKDFDLTDLGAAAEVMPEQSGITCDGKKILAQTEITDPNDGHWQATFTLDEDLEIKLRTLNKVGKRSSARRMGQWTHPEMDLCAGLNRQSDLARLDGAIDAQGKKFDVILQCLGK